jgi:hypothetical protein
VDAVSLATALLVWKMKFQKGMQHAAIAAELMDNPFSFNSAPTISNLFMYLKA